MTESNESICARLKNIQFRQESSRAKIQPRVFNLRKKIQDAERNIARLEQQLNAAKAASRAAAAIGAVGRLAKKPVPGAIGQAVQRTAAQIAVERLKAELRQAKSNLGRMRQRLKDDEKELGQLTRNLETTKRDLDKFNC